MGVEDRLCRRRTRRGDEVQVPLDFPAELRRALHDRGGHGGVRRRVPDMAARDDQEVSGGDRAAGHDREGFRPVTDERGGIRTGRHPAEGTCLQLPDGFAVDQRAGHIAVFDIGGGPALGEPVGDGTGDGRSPVAAVPAGDVQMHRLAGGGPVQGEQLTAGAFDGLPGVRGGQDVVADLGVQAGQCDEWRGDRGVGRVPHPVADVQHECAGVMPGRGAPAGAVGRDPDGGDAAGHGLSCRRELGAVRSGRPVSASPLPSAGGRFPPRLPPTDVPDIAWPCAAYGRGVTGERAAVVSDRQWVYRVPGSFSYRSRLPPKL